MSTDHADWDQRSPGVKLKLPSPARRGAGPAASVHAATVTPLPRRCPHGSQATGPSPSGRKAARSRQRSRPAAPTALSATAPGG